MKKIIIKYGIISGCIVASLMLICTLVIRAIGYEKVGFDYSALIGYTYIFLALAVIYVAIKYFKENINDGKVNFSQGLLIGLGITVISSVFYSLMWLVVYKNFMPNFMDDYSAYELNKMTLAGETVEAIEKMKSQMESYKEMYKSPIKIFFMTMIEPAPVGLVVTLISAWWHRSK